MIVFAVPAVGKERKYDSKEEKHRAGSTNYRLILPVVGGRWPGWGIQFHHNQKQIFADYVRRNGDKNTQFFVDDGVSGTTFQRDGFHQMQKMVEDGLIGTIIVKDLSHVGRDQIEMGRLLQIVYPSLGVTFISIQEGVNTTTKTGMQLVPFVNIFNEL